MKKVAILILITFMTSAAIVNAETIQQGTDRFVSFLTMPQKGESILIPEGETRTIFTQNGKITVQLLEIAHNPAEVSDIAVGEIQFSDENPEPGQEVFISAPISNIGTGDAGVSIQISYGDGIEGSVMAMILHPGESTDLKAAHTYSVEGAYSIMISAFAGNDIDTSNNIQCRTIRVGNSSEGAGGCGIPSPSIIPEKAHILYTEYSHGQVINSQDIWLSPEDIGQAVEVLKLGRDKALLTVPR